MSNLHIVTTPVRGASSIVEEEVLKSFTQAQRMTSNDSILTDTQAELAAELEAARASTDQLFKLISDEDLYERPLPQRHRLIFYAGHLEAFDWNQIGRLALGQPHLHKTFDRLFERGIDPEPGQLPSDEPADWPSLDETRSYIHKVRQRLDDVWNEVPAGIQQVAIEHRWMHAETLAYILHNFPHERKRRPSSELVMEPHVPALVDHRFVTIPAGIATLGRKPEHGFGWDNEFDETVINVPSFTISKYKVTNGDYLAFVEQGQEPPHFWSKEQSEWMYRGMFDLVPLPLDAPVYVTQQQASGYARWRGMQLPTEAQFHRAAYGTPEGGERALPWGADPGHPSVHGNFDFQHWDPVPVTAYPGGRSAFGVAQMVGNGWEWTNTQFAPFPGFAPFPYYPGYSADFFDQNHFVLKGASPRTAAKLTRRSLRNWFRPDYPYLYATFRLVEN